jgi:hypothetical protein
MIAVHCGKKGQDNEYRLDDFYAYRCRHGRIVANASASGHKHRPGRALRHAFDTPMRCMRFK